MYTNCFKGDGVFQFAPYRIRQYTFPAFLTHPATMQGALFGYDNGVMVSF